MPPKVINWWKVDFDESDIASVATAIQSKCISMGKITEKLEQDLAAKLDVPYVIACSSGSAALLMTLIALEIREGDEVILPDRTWIACLNALAILGATPILIDVKKNIPTMDLTNIEKKITKKTKAIIPSPLNGRKEDMDRIWQIARENDLFVVEDAAQALFSMNNGAFIGTQSRFSIFSLGIAKLITSGQGGFITVRRHEDYEKLKLIRNNGVHNLPGKNPYKCMGLNFKITDFQSALALNSLKKLTQKKSNLLDVYKTYEKGLENIKGISLIPVNTDEGELPLYIEALSEKRLELITELDLNNIEAKIFIDSLHTSPVIKSTGLFPNSDTFEKKGLVLPCGPDQALFDIERVIQIIKHINN